MNNVEEKVIELKERPEFVVPSADMQLEDGLASVEGYVKPIEQVEDDESKTVVEGNKSADLLSIFGQTSNDYNYVNKMFGAVSEQRQKIYAEINIYSKLLTGKEISYKQIMTVKDSAYSIGKDVGKYTDTEIQLIFKSAGIIINPDKENIKEGISVEMISRVFLEAILSTNETDQLFAVAEAKRKEITQQTMDELDNILGSIDMAKQLGDLAEKIDKETDPDVKKILNDQYMGLYNIISLDLIMQKIQNKPLKIIKRDCNKEYDIVEKKARKIIVNDKKNYFLDIKYLRNTMESIFPDLKDEIKVFLYIIYKQITKRKEVPAQLVSFINFFILNIGKMTSKSYESDKNMIEHKDKIRVMLEKLK